MLRLPKDVGPTDLRAVISTLLAALKSDDIAGALWIARAGRVRRWQPPAASGQIDDAPSDVA